MKPKALYILSAGSFPLIYGKEQQAEIEEMCDVIAPPQTRETIWEHPELLCEVEFVFSGWGPPVMNAKFLAAAPKLRAVFYGAGTIRQTVTPEFWQRNIVITSSWVANAIPVAEFTLAEILLSLKLAWRHIGTMKRNRKYVTDGKNECPGAYRSTVALLSLGMIGKMVAKHLRAFDLKVLAYDPFATEEDAAALGVELVSLDEAFTRADVISMHTPWLPQTEKMIQAKHFEMMKKNATFINTSRGAIVDEPAMLQVLAKRTDITAVLDVVWPEPPQDDSPLFTLENVIFTPHIAGSLSRECNRMGQYAVDECRRFLKGEPLLYQVTEKMAERMA